MSDGSPKDEGESCRIRAQQACDALLELLGEQERPDNVGSALAAAVAVPEKEQSSPASLDHSFRVAPVKGTPKCLRRQGAHPEPIWPEMALAVKPAPEPANRNVRAERGRRIGQGPMGGGTPAPLVGSIPPFNPLGKPLVGPREPTPYPEPNRLAETPSSLVTVSLSSSSEGSPGPISDRTPEGARSRAWCFTLNNFAEHEETLRDHLVGCRNLVYMVYGREHVNQPGKTPHLQGYVYFSNQVGWASLMRSITPHAYWVPAKGTPEQNRAYCTKEDPQPFERGVMPHAGRRTDILELKAAVKRGATMEELIDSDMVGGFQALKCAETLMKYQPMPADRPELRVYWYYGPSGCSKTYTALQEARASQGGVWKSSQQGLTWWEKYSGQRNVVIDEYRADFCPFPVLLQILDVYPFQVSIKGSSAWLKATQIWITTPESPEVTWASRAGLEQFAQLKRRITLVRQFTTVYVKPQK